MFKFGFSDDLRLGVSTEYANILALEIQAKSIKQQRDAIPCSVEGNVYELFLFHVTAIT
jgi:hypothetical protein